MLLPLAAALAVLTGQTRIDLVGQVRLSTQARTAYLGDDPRSPVAFDADATPSLAAAIEHAGGRVLLGYAPTFRVREPYSTPPYRRFEANQYEYLFMQWFREGRPRPYLTQSLSVGTADWATLFQQSGIAGSTFPGVTLPGLGTPGATTMGQGALLNSPKLNGTFNQFYFDANGGISWPLSRLVTLDTAGGFTYGGGTDVPSEIILPTETLGRGRAQLDVRVDRVDTLAVRSELLYVTFAKAPTTLAVFTELDATGRWKRELSALLTGEVVLGGSTIRAWPGGSPRPTWSVVPIGQGILSAHAASGPHLVSFDALVGVAPFIDRFNADVYERFDTTGTLLYTFRQAWQLALRGGVGQSLQPVNGGAVTTGIIEARAGYVPPRLWRVDLTATNSANVYGPALINTWLVALSVTLRAEGTY